MLPEKESCNRNIHTGYVKIPCWPGWRRTSWVYIVWRSSSVIPFIFTTVRRKIFGLIKVGSGMSYVTYANLKSMAFCHLFSCISGRVCVRDIKTTGLKWKRDRRKVNPEQKTRNVGTRKGINFFQFFLIFPDISLKNIPAVKRHMDKEVTRG